MYVLEEKPYNVSTCYVSSTPFEEMTLDSLLSKNCTTWPVHIRHPHMIGHTLYHMTSSHTTPSYDWSYRIWQPPCDWLYVMWPVHMSQGHLSGGINNNFKIFYQFTTDFSQTCNNKTKIRLSHLKCTETWTSHTTAFTCVIYNRMKQLAWHMWFDWTLVSEGKSPL